MKKILIIIMILFNIFYLFPEYYDLNLDYSQFELIPNSEIEYFIIGLWADSFPVDSGYKITYKFEKNHNFVFKNYTVNETVNGIWKYEKFKILIKIDSDKSWKIICDIRSYNRYWHPFLENIPPKLEIIMIKDKFVQQYVKGFFKYE